MKVLVLILTMIILDWISGICEAWYKGELSSSKMREGLFHKFAEMGLIMLSKLIDYGCEWLGIYTGVNFYSIVCIYIFIMETRSIYENLKGINSKIKIEEIEDLERWEDDGSGK